MDGIKVFKEPLKQNILEFLTLHSGCDCIAKREYNSDEPIAEIYAYAEKPKYNTELARYYEKRGYKEPIRMFRGISEEEVDSID